MRSSVGNLLENELCDIVNRSRSSWFVITNNARAKQICFLYLSAHIIYSISTLEKNKKSQD